MQQQLFQAAAIGLALALAPAGALAAKRSAPAPRPTRTGLESIERQVQTFTLANGLRFLLVERHDAPVFSFFTAVGSGSANDGIGTTGLAHMMEHMAFKGTTLVGTKDWPAEREAMANEERAYDAYMLEKRKGARADTARLAALEGGWRKAVEDAQSLVDPNAYTRWIEQAGGQGINAFTADDLTGYFYALPSNRLELWAAMHAGAFVDPVFREFYKERDVVYEERRMRYESSPTGRLLLEFLMAAFPAHAYGFGGIGYPSDLKSFSREEGEEFFRRNYVARNMTIALVGDVTLAQAKAVAKRYFSAISDAPAPQPLDTEELPQEGERRVILEDTAQPILGIGWKIPPNSSREFVACQAMADILGGGRHSRLHKALVNERKLATQVFVGTGFPGERYANLMLVYVIPAAGQDPLAVEAAVYEVFDAARKDKPFTRDELAGYQVRVRAQKIAAVEDNDDLAGSLAQAQAVQGDWREFFRGQERVQSLTPADLQAVLDRFVVRKNRTVAMIVPPATASAEGGH